MAAEGGPVRLGRSGVYNVYRQSPSAGSSSEQLTANASNLFPSSLSRDAARLFVTSSTRRDVMVLATGSAYGAPHRPREQPEIS